MSIYITKGIDTNKTFSQGNKVEADLLEYFNNKRNLKAKKVPHAKYSFDLAIKDTNTGKVYAIEIKSHKGVSNYGIAYSTFFAETVQNIDKPREKSTPEYLTSNRINYVIQVNLHDGYAYVFDAALLKQYVYSNLDKEREAPNATSKGILIKWSNKAAGYKKRFKLY